MPSLSYGRDGLVGCATPQANPTVEPELRQLLPASVNLQMARSTGRGDARARLLAYFNGMASTIECFGGMPLDAFGFACTASSYLLEPGQEAAHIGTLENRFGFPVCTASRSVERALRQLGVRRILIGSPYPDWIHQACLEHWQRAGFRIAGETTAQPQMEDTRAIYTLDPQRVAEHLEARFSKASADVLLITGTGLPTLPIRARLQNALGMPVLSANLCLAWNMLETIRPNSAMAQRLEQELSHASPCG